MRKGINGRSLMLGAASLLFLVVGACAQNGDCSDVDDPKIVKKLLEVVRIRVEFFRDTDNYAHTLEVERGNSSLVISECSRNIVLYMRTASTPDGPIRVGGARKFVIKKSVFSIVSDSYE